MNAHQIDGAWVFDGDNTGAPDLGAGDCAVNHQGGPNTVHGFVAPAAGTYTARIEAMGDTLLFARSHCALASSEVACNDDADPDRNDRLSGVSVDLDEAEPVYVFVDGFAGMFEGAYTLTIRMAE